MISLRVTSPSRLQSCSLHTSKCRIWKLSTTLDHDQTIQQPWQSQLCCHVTERTQNTILQFSQFFPCLMLMMMMNPVAANMWRLGSAVAGDKKRWQLCAGHHSHLISSWYWDCWANCLNSAQLMRLHKNWWQGQPTFSHQLAVHTVWGRHSKHHFSNVQYTARQCALFLTL